MNIQIKEQLKADELFVGIILGKDGAPNEGIVLLPGEFEGNHGDAAKWAESIGGALPTRREQSLLFANQAEEFKGFWYWAAEQHGSSYAWVQDFYYGIQVCHAP